jgi:hypothetical protein
MGRSLDDGSRAIVSLGMSRWPNSRIRLALWVLAAFTARGADVHSQQRRHGRPFHAEYTTARDPGLQRVRPFLDQPDNRAACRTFCAEINQSDPNHSCTCHPGIMPR